MIDNILVYLKQYGWIATDMNNIKTILILIIPCTLIFLAFYLSVYNFALGIHKPDFCVKNELSQQCLDYQNGQNPKELNEALKLFFLLIITQVLAMGYILRKLGFSLLNSALTILCSNVSIVILVFIAVFAFTMSTDSAKGPQDPNYTYANAKGTFNFLLVLFLLIPPVIYTLFYKVFKSTTF